MFRSPETCDKGLMRLSLRVIAISLLLAATGCHVVDRAKQCGHLSAAIRGAEKELTEPLSENPSAQSLRDRAAAFSRLARTLKQLPTHAPQVDKARQQAIELLKELERDLTTAAGAVERHPAEKAEAKKKRDQARERREKQLHEQSRRREIESKGAKADKSLPKKLEALAAEKLEAVRQEAKPVNPLKAKKKNKGTIRPLPSTAAMREYRRVKRSIENTGKRLTGTLKQLQSACNS